MHVGAKSFQNTFGYKLRCNVALSPDSRRLNSKVNTLFNAFKTHGPVVQKEDSAIHWINHHPADNTKDCVNTYPLDSDLPGGEHHPPFEQPGPAGVVIATCDGLLAEVFLKLY